MNKDNEFIVFDRPKWSEKINHLSYADDIILFYFEHKKSVRKMIRVLQRYENVPGQLINLSKSYIYLHVKVLMANKHKIRRLAGISIGSFPFTYLGCPIFYERQKKIYFEEIVNNLAKRILSWHSKLLTYGGRYVLLCNVLQFMPIYLMSAMSPPKGIVDQIHKLMKKLFWGKTDGTKGKHWVAWN